MIFIIFTVYVTLSKLVNGANILYVAPFPSLSHFQMMKPVMLRLAERGHNVTVLSHYPLNDTIVNYTNIDLRGSVQPGLKNFMTMTYIKNSIGVFQMSSIQCECVMSSKNVQNFLKNDQKFDLIFLEIMATDCYLGFAMKYQVPYILINSQPLTSWISDWIYNPTEISYVPDCFCRIGGRMNFFGRMWNFICHVFMKCINRFYNMPISVQLARKYFQNEIDSFEELKSNASMIFVNSFHGYCGVRPVLPNVIELGGIHIGETKPIPNIIREFLDGATEGVIVFSMGSMVKSDTLQPRLREIFVKVFRELNQRILWKWESQLKEKPPNAMIMNWIPQSDVLGHKKVKLFISHGGNHGVIEAAYHGVPVLGFPLYGDQKANLMNLERVGMAKILNLESVTYEMMLSFVREIIHDERYAKNAKRISKIMRDRPIKPVDLAIFWTEYILRNGPFKNPTFYLNWFEYHQIDVILFILFISIIFIFFLQLILKIFFHVFFYLIRKFILIKIY